MRRALRVLAGVVLGLVARVWLWTLRLRVEAHPALEGRGDAPWVLAFFHGTQWPLLAWRRRRPTAVMVSLSDDGAMQARALRLLGLEVVRGSSSRGGVRALAALVRLLARGGRDVAFAVDGPRGPRGRAKPGVVFCARRAGAVVVPMGSAARRAKVFVRAWDRFTLAWPLSEAVVVLGAPVSLPDDDEAAAEAVEHAIAEANARAEVLLASPERRMVRFSPMSPEPRSGPAVWGREGARSGTIE